MDAASAHRPPLTLTGRAIRFRRVASLFGLGMLFTVTCLSMVAVLFIFYFIAKDALPFFQAESISDFFFNNRWYPSREEAEFGAFAIFYGSLIVTIGAAILAIPVGVCSAVCLSDILPFSLRQYVKPIVEILASIPSVAYGFFALVVFAPQLQDSGGAMLEVATWIIGIPISAITSILMADTIASRINAKSGWELRAATGIILFIPGVFCLAKIAAAFGTIEISSGTNALNVAIILGIMALPTVVSVSEDALQAIGPDLRMASYGLGATRAETILKSVLPAAASGILAAVLLGIMRAVGETMVVWMASGNASQVPEPWYNITAPVRTLTATIAGDMGEADHVTGSSRYHVLFAMALCLLTISFICNIISEKVVKRSRRRLKGGA